MIIAVGYLEPFVVFGSLTVLVYYISGNTMSLLVFSLQPDSLSVVAQPRSLAVECCYLVLYGVFFAHTLAVQCLG